MKFKILLLLGAASLLVASLVIGRVEKIGILEEKSDAGEGGVTVRIKPLWEDLGQEEDLVFELTLDTHSVDLTDFNIVENIRLVSGNAEQPPKEWREKEGSNHHRSGNVVFRHFAADADNIELVIRNLAGISERRIDWEF